MAEPKDESAHSVLELTTLIERPKISVDGELYEILSPAELSVIESQRFAAQGRKYDGLMAKDSLSDPQKKRVSKLVRDLADKIMVGVPDDKREKLSEAQKMEVIEVFTGLLLRRRLKAAGAMRQAPNQSTGAK